MFGAGAIGTYIGGTLLLHNHEVTFLEQAATIAGIRERGLHLTFDNGEEHHISDPHLSGTIGDALKYGPFNAAIFALKSFDTSPVLETLEPYRQSMPPIICLQNGVENEVKIAKILGADQVIAGTITSSISRRAAGDIVLERKRGFGLSSQHASSRELIHEFQSAGLNARLFPNPEDMKWSKLLTNLVGNATSAILDFTPAQVFACPQLYKLEIQQLRETLAVMQAKHIHAINLPGVPVSLLAFAVRHLPHQIAQPLLQHLVGGGRGAKMPSFHIDLHSGRGQSEVDYLNGAVVRAGEQAHIPTPVNALLNHTLLGLTSGSLSREFFAHNPKALLERLRD